MLAKDLWLGLGDGGVADLRQLHLPRVGRRRELRLEQGAAGFLQCQSCLSGGVGAGLLGNVDASPLGAGGVRVIRG